MEIFIIKGRKIWGVTGISITELWKMFCEFLGVEREGQTYQLLIGEYNQSQRNPFVPHTTLLESSVVLTV
jgi:hypothetical protein